MDSRKNRDPEWWTVEKTEASLKSGQIRVENYSYFRHGDVV